MSLASERVLHGEIPFRALASSLTYSATKRLEDVKKFGIYTVRSLFSKENISTTLIGGVVREAVTLTGTHVLGVGTAYTHVVAGALAGATIAGIKEARRQKAEALQSQLFATNQVYDRDLEFKAAIEQNNGIELNENEKGHLLGQTYESINDARKRDIDSLTYKFYRDWSWQYDLDKKALLRAAVLGGAKGAIFAFGGGMLADKLHSMVFSSNLPATSHAVNLNTAPNTTIGYTDHFRAIQHSTPTLSHDYTQTLLPNQPVEIPSQPHTFANVSSPIDAPNPGSTHVLERLTQPRVSINNETAPSQVLGRLRELARSVKPIDTSALHTISPADVQPDMPAANEVLALGGDKSSIWALAKEHLQHMGNPNPSDADVAKLTKAICQEYNIRSDSNLGGAILDRSLKAGFKVNFGQIASKLLRAA